MLRWTSVFAALLMAGLSLPFATAIFAQDSKAVAKSATGHDWPQFLGPQRNGISAGTGLLNSWTGDGPPEVWRVPGGVGMSGLAIDRGRVVTLVQRDGQQCVLVLDVADGRTRHVVPIAPEFTNAMGAGPRATPAISGDTAYVFTGEGVLAAVDLVAGKVAWSRNVVKELGGKSAEYGMACSPLAIGERVVVTVGAPRGTVAAFERATGATAWTAITDGDTAGYSSPALLNVAGSEQLVAFEGKAALGIAPQSGKVLWRFPYETDFDCNIATPIAHEGRVFISSGENHGCALLSLEATGDTFQAKPVWESHGPSSVMRNEWQTSILHDRHLYGFDNVGSAGPVTHLNCVEIATGKRKWQQLRFGKGNLIFADGKLFLTTMKGELVVARANPERYEELGRKTVLRTTRQAPALAQGRLYLRDDRDIVCLDVREKK
jgi:outer membrane protein assembly factor BamB